MVDVTMTFLMLFRDCFALHCPWPAVGLSAAGHEHDNNIQCTFAYLLLCLTMSGCHTDGGGGGRGCTVIPPPQVDIFFDNISS